MFLLVEVRFHLTSYSLVVVNSRTNVNVLELTSSRLVCFCRLADMVEVPDISFSEAEEAAVSGLGRGIPEGLSWKGTGARLGVPLRVPLACDDMICMFNARAQTPRQACIRDSLASSEQVWPFTPITSQSCRSGLAPSIGKQPLWHVQGSALGGTKSWQSLG